MKLFHCFFCLSALLVGGCARNSSQTWEDIKTAGRYMQRGVDALIGKDYDSRMLTTNEEFTGPDDGDFIPLKDADLKSSSLAMADVGLPQPKGIPGKLGIPSLEQFYLPHDTLRSLFRTVHFDTDDHVLRDKNELQMMQDMVAYLKKHPNVYLMIAGHCDERASASYNLALGMRRAGYVRSLLVNQGIDLNRLYTVSRGKEEPISEGHTPNDWKLNRRTEFKMYEK